MDKIIDHIFIISRCSNFKRRKYLDKQLSYLGITNYQYWYVPDFDFDNSNIFKKLYGEKISLSNRRTSIGHYFLWKMCNDLEYDNILIIEDDVEFIKDLNIYKKIIDDFNEVKHKFDIYMFDYFKDYNYSHIIDKYIFADCYFVNRNGLKFLINQHERYNLIVDHYFYDFSKNDNEYLCILNDFFGTKLIFLKEDKEMKLGISPIHLCIEPSKYEELKLYKESIDNPELYYKIEDDNT